MKGYEKYIRLFRLHRTFALLRFASLVICVSLTIIGSRLSNLPVRLGAYLFGLLFLLLGYLRVKNKGYRTLNLMLIIAVLLLALLDTLASIMSSRS